VHADLRVVPHVVRDFAAGSRAAGGEYALVTSRLSREKGVEVAIAACREAEIPLVVAGDGPLRDALRAGAADVRFTGLVAPAQLAELRARAAVALVPSLAAETYGLAALEAMAAGVPVAASDIGALSELRGEVALTPPGDSVALARAARAAYRDAAAGERGIAAARARAAPEVVAPLLGAAYGG
jgi:glycosyltransferase involved in cell wall biosynthesis